MHLRNFIALRPSTWLDELVETYKIDVAEDPAVGLVSLKYNQIDSPMHEPVVQECRGIVVEKATGRIVCHPYNKFWNLGEKLAAEIDWDTARIQDKLDGSLILLYEHDGRWNVASSGHPTAGGSYGSAERTFRAEVWAVISELEMYLPPLRDYADVGFFFELCAPTNRIVVRYDRPRLVLHGARHRVTGEELDRRRLVGIAEMYKWEIVKEHPLRSPLEVLAAVNALDPLASEGFVVVDDQFRRLKVKSPRYIALHQLRDQRSPSAIIGLWKRGEVGEVLAAFPEFEADVTAVITRLEVACSLAFDAYLRHRNLPTRKEYAAAVLAEKLACPMLAFRLLDDGGQSVYDAEAILRRALASVAEKIVEGAP